MISAWVFNALKKDFFRNLIKVSQDELNERFNEGDIVFFNCDLASLNFDGADLRSAKFKHCNLMDTSFHGTNLDGASFDSCCGDFVEFCGAYITNVDINNCYFRWSRFCGAYITAKLYDTFITNSVFDGATIDIKWCEKTELLGSDFSKATFLYPSDLMKASNFQYIPLACPDEGEFIGWKRCRDNRIVKLLIPEDAKRSSATGRKCRCDKAVVLEIQDQSGRKLSDNKAAYSEYDIDFEYKVGETVSVDNFCDDRWDECASGIHFFINRQEAVEY